MDSDVIAELHADVASHDDPPNFCEQCGAEGPPPSLTAALPNVGALRVCSSCQLVSCSQCWPHTLGMCVVCTLQVHRHAVSSQPWRILRRRPVLAAAASVVVVAVVAIAMGLVPPGIPAGAVGGATARATLASPAATTGGAATTNGTTTPSPMLVASPEASPSGAGPADLTVSNAVIRPWVDSVGEVRAQVFVGVTNRGGTAGYLPPAETSYRVKSPAGDTVAQGLFAHVFPAYVEPGRTAWFVDTLSATFTDGDALDSVDVDLATRPPDQADADRASSLSVTNVDWSIESDGTVVAFGRTTNDGALRVSRLAVGVILLGYAGEPLAGVYDVQDVHNLEPGASAPFSTSYPGSAPVRRAAVASVQAFAIAIAIEG